MPDTAKKSEFNQYISILSESDPITLKSRVPRRNGDAILLQRDELFTRIDPNHDLTKFCDAVYFFAHILSILGLLATKLSVS